MNILNLNNPEVDLDINENIPSPKQSDLSEDEVEQFHDHQEKPVTLSSSSENSSDDDTPHKNYHDDVRKFG